MSKKDPTEEEYDDEEYDDEEEDLLDEILDQVYDWGVAFSKSSYFEELNEEQKDWSEAVVGSFTERAYSYMSAEPEEWDVGVLDEVCLEIIPAKDTAEESFFRAIGPVLSAFFYFLDEQGLLDGAGKLAARAKKIEKAIVRNSQDPRRWGMAKSLAMTAVEAGVDLTDEKQLDAFFTAYNEHIARSINALAQPGPAQAAERGPKVGRNDPCPCGSGKKYKNCCGRGH